ncbi:MAG: hypothetical protein B7Z08_00030, partial [Sphingomonadales bacterium 32-68-7]
MYFFEGNRLWRSNCASALIAAMIPVAGHAQPAPAPAAETVAAPDLFTINAIDVNGVTVLPAAVVERAIYPFLGPDRSSNDVEAARQAVQDAYAAAGYESVQVDIPPQPSQAFARGLVALNVTEAAIGAVRVTGAEHHSSRVVREQFASIQPGEPLNLRALQSDLAAANRFPDREVTPSFLPAAEPGKIDVELNVNSSLPVHASLELNNDHSPSTEPLRAIGSVRYTDMWSLGHTLSGSWIVAPQNTSQTKVFSAAYSAPLLGTPWTLVVFGYNSNSDIAALGGSNVLGNGYQVGVRASYLLPTQSSQQTFSFGFDYKNFDQSIFVGGVSAGKAPIEYMPFAASYSLASATENSTLDLTISTTVGLRVFKKLGCFAADPTVPPQDCPIVDQFRNRDLDAVENFSHVNLDATYNRSLPGDFVAAFRLSAQLADSHLVTNEQFAAGGLTSVRGYLQSEAVGDNGLVTSLELRLPSLAPYLPDVIDELRLFGFVDTGRIHVLRTLP